MSSADSPVLPMLPRQRAEVSSRCAHGAETREIDAVGSGGGAKTARLRMAYCDGHSFHSRRAGSLNMEVYREQLPGETVPERHLGVAGNPVRRGGTCRMGLGLAEPSF